MESLTKDQDEAKKQQQQVAEDEAIAKQESDKAKSLADEAER